MTEQHKATPEQWERQELRARLHALDDQDAPCILELRDRVAALEADQLNQAESQRFCVDAIVRRIEALEAAQQLRTFTAEEVASVVVPTVKESLADPAGSLVERVATDAELCKVYNDAPEHGFGPALRAVYDLGRQHGATPAQPGSESSPASSLVERVGRVIESEDGPIPAVGSAYTPEARAAILEVAAWLRSEYPRREGYGTAWANLIEQEANR